MPETWSFSHLEVILLADPSPQLPTVVLFSGGVIDFSYCEVKTTELYRNAIASNSPQFRNICFRSYRGAKYGVGYFPCLRALGSYV